MPHISKFSGTRHLVYKENAAIDEYVRPHPPTKGRQRVLVCGKKLFLECVLKESMLFDREDAVHCEGRFLHSKAEEVLGTSEPRRWSRSSVRGWIDSETRGRFERRRWIGANMRFCLSNRTVPCMKGMLLGTNMTICLLLRHGA